MNNQVVFAFLLTLIAGLFTGVGGIIALSAKRTNTKFLSVSLGFAAGVMLYVSMIEIFHEAQEFLTTASGERLGSLLNVASFFAGIILIALLDRLVPHHHVDNPTGGNVVTAKDKETLLRTGLLITIALSIHSFPEGFATFISAINDPPMAVPLIVAVALHNIPIGISVALPVYYGTDSKGKAFLYSLIPGLAGPVGAVIGYLLLSPFMNDVVYGIVFSISAGIMVFVSLAELLPAAQEYSEDDHLPIYGLIAGMLVMAVSLIFV